MCRHCSTKLAWSIFFIISSSRSCSTSRWRLATPKMKHHHRRCSCVAGDSTITRGEKWEIGIDGDLTCAWSYQVSTLFNWCTIVGLFDAPACHPAADPCCGEPSMLSRWRYVLVGVSTWSKMISHRHRSHSPLFVPPLRWSKCWSRAATSHKLPETKDGSIVSAWSATIINRKSPEMWAMPLDSRAVITEDHTNHRPLLAKCYLPLLVVQATSIA